MAWGQKTRQRENEKERRERQRGVEKREREQNIREAQARESAWDKQRQAQNPEKYRRDQEREQERRDKALLRSQNNRQKDQYQLEALRIREDGKTQRQQLRAQNAAARRAARAAGRASGAPTVAGAIMGSIVASVLLFAVIVSTGPLVDYFQVWLTQQNGNPYAAPVLDLFTWIYILAFVSWITYIIVVWRAVTMNVSYGVYD